MEVINLPENLAIASSIPNYGYIEVEGTGKSLLGLKLFFSLGSSYPRINIDAFDAKLGKTTMLLSNKNAFLPSASMAKVLRIIEPRQISFRIDARLKRKYPIILNLDVSSAENYVFEKDIKIKPESVTVFGPRAHIVFINEINTQAEKISGLIRDTSFTLFLKRPQRPGIILVPNKVKALVKVHKLKKKQINNIPIEFINLPENVPVKFSSSTVSMVIAGGEPLIKSIKQDDIMVVLDYRRFLLEDETSLTPVIKIFGEVTWYNLKPRKILLLREP